MESDPYVRSDPQLPEKSYINVLDGVNSNEFVNFSDEKMDDSVNFDDVENEEVSVNLDVDENTKESEKCCVGKNANDDENASERVKSDVYENTCVFENICVGNKLTGKPQKCES